MDMNCEESVAPKTLLPSLFSAVDENKEKFIDNLKKIVSIPSISNNPEYSKDVLKLLEVCAHKLEHYGFLTNLIDGNNESSKDLPPVLFASLFSSPEYKTLCVYGNIDALEPENIKSEDSPAFNLIEREGRLYGCGVADNKAPLMCWFNAIKVYKITNEQIPVNIKFVIEGTSKSYSSSLRNAILRNRIFFSDTEFICLTIDQKNNHEACLKYSYRGLCHFTFITECGDRKVHSGTHGGSFNQPLMDAVNIMSNLTDEKEKIIIPHFSRDVAPTTEFDELNYAKHMSFDSLKEEIGMESLRHKNKPFRIFKHKTHLPSLSITSMFTEEADPEDYSSLPNRVEVKFIVRLVPNQKVKKIYAQINSYINNLQSDIQSTNSFELKMDYGFEPWKENPLSNHYAAAAAAIKTVYNVTPTYISEGNTLPAVSIFKEKCPTSNMLIMPIGDYDSECQSSYESISVESYIKGIKLVLAYMCEVHDIIYD